MNELLKEFANDPGVKLVAALILLDLVFGAAVAAKKGYFRLPYFVDFLRNDVLGKVVPYFGVWAAVRLSGDLQVGGVGAIEEGVGAAVVAALGASVLNSMREWGIGRTLPDGLAGDEHSPAPPSA